MSHRWRLLRTGRRQSLSQTFQRGPANKLLEVRWGWGQICRNSKSKKCVRTITDSMMSRTEWRILDCFSRMSCEHQFHVKLTSALILLIFFILIGQYYHSLDKNFFVVILIERLSPLDNLRTPCTSSTPPRRLRNRTIFPHNWHGRRRDISAYDKKIRIGMDIYNCQNCAHMRNWMKYFWFLSPTQLLIQGQWWSIRLEMKMLEI